MLYTLVLLTTTRCDLKCQHCLRGFPYKQADIPLDIVEQLLVDAKDFGARHVAFTGGEPCLHPKFRTLVSLVADHDYTWSFISHGGMYDRYEPLVTQYKERVKQVSLSLDGATAETHDTIRQKPGAFDRVTTAIRLFAQQGFTVRVVTTLNNVNQSELEDILLLAVKLGAQRFHCTGTIPTMWNRHLYLKDAERETLFQRLRRIQNDLPIHVTHASSLHTPGGVNFCHMLNLHKLTISARAQMLFCCDTIGKGAVVGSLKTHSLPSLLRRWMGLSAQLQQERIQRLSTGATCEGFNSCSFCNAYLSQDVLSER